MRGAVRVTAAMAGLLLSSGVLVAGIGVQTASAATVPAAATTRVNIRTGPSTGTKILGQLVRGQRITTTASPVKGWVRVRFDGGTAYMYASYLNLTGTKVPTAPKTITTAGIKIATEAVNVRSGPAASYGVVGTLPEGTDLVLTGKLSGGYAQTSYAQQLRWVSVEYLASSTKTAAAPAPAPVVTPPSTGKGATALAFAKKQLGKPYKFGAAGPSAYDCSGLTLASWRAAGVTLPRTAAQQYKLGHRISKSSLQPGDLVFFYSQTPSHVAIYVGDGQVIHSPRPGKKVEYIKMSYMPYAGAVRPG